jgi:hypothetical protein
MHGRIRGLAATVALLAGASLALGLGACGSGSSGQAKTLLKQTFGGNHRVDSGNLSFNVTLNPSGSRTISGPISFSFGGPFQTLGTGKLPQSNFTVSVSALGKTGSLGLISTGQSGFVSLGGTSYQMPAATFQKLESSFSGLTSTTSGGSGSALTRLGIDPLRWLTNPSIAGNESVGGADTTHIKAGIDVVALLGDLGTFLQKASSVGVPNAARIPTSISAATRAKIARAVQNPHFDVWTGTSDKTPRKLAITLTLPVTGQISTLLGGLRSASVALSLQYANLNQPQTITAPPTVRPFAEFQAKLKSFQQSLQSFLTGTLGGGAGSGTTGSGTTGSGTTGSGSTGSGGAAPGTSTNVQAYSQCVQAAGSDIVKLQKCSALLSK